MPYDLRPMPFYSEHESSYHKYHQRRLLFAWDIIQSLRPVTSVEIGAWTLSYWMRVNGFKMDTLGFPEKRIEDIAGELDMDVTYNLNLLRKSKNERTWFTREYYLVVACEVIEHLPFDMNLVFEFFNHLLKHGGRLLIQTPNGVALKKRMAMLFGRNPFQLIHDYNNGTYDHLREPTIAELIAFGTNNGFVAEQVYCKNYFDYSHSWKAKLYEQASKLLPQNFHDGITILFKKR